MLCVTLRRALVPLAVVFSFSRLIHAGEEVQFNRDIRPILSANCFYCHGPDSKHREADLRLDSAEGILQAFAGGNLARSEAWARITTDDESIKMPPVDSHRELTKEQIDLLRKWAEQGAKYQGHWAFIPPEKPVVPEVKFKKFIRNEIDNFVLRRLEQEGLKPSSEAEKMRLLRRVTFDLTGLPPTIEEIEAFLKDESPNAYEKVVDRLLASPHYGERMALAWLDLARYGDTSVFHADGPRTMWPWRDWVIQSYNQNKPFDEFTREQLAGDLMPDSTVEQKVATAFLRNNASTDEGGVIAEEFRVEYAVDRVKTTSMVWLGLTMECSQCHEHKYDPISQEDYYRFYDYFNQAADPGMQTRKGNQAPVVDVPDYERLAKLPGFEKELAGIQAQLKGRKPLVEKDFQQWLAAADGEGKQIAAAPADAILLCTFEEEKGDAVLNISDKNIKGSIKGRVLRDEGKFGQSFRLDGSNYVDLGDIGRFERDQAFSYGAWVRPTGKMFGAVIARMDDRGGHRGYDLYMHQGRLSVHIINHWPGNAVKVTTNAALKKDLWQHVFVTYDGSSKASGIKIYVDGEPQEWRIEVDKLSGTTVTNVPLYIGRRNPGSAFTGQVDDVRLFDRLLSEVEVKAIHGSDPLFAKAPEDRTKEDLEALRNYYLSTQDPVARKLRIEQRRLEAEIAAAKKPVGNVMVMQDVGKRRTTYLLERGHYASPNKEKPLTAGVPEALGPLPEGAPPNRLGLAMWLTRPDHPLTARVAVNRYWYMFFGAGLVNTLEDFGSQGDWPTHPELLDWLAVDFVENGWDIKRTIKQIVMSGTYQQTSRITPELRERDPKNELLARGPRFRLQGEFIRDNALAAAGLLVNRIGGPGVKPYQPPGLWSEVSLDGNVRFVQDKGEKLYRRSMYIYWKRSAPAPSMTIFDAPSRETCTIRRSRTNTPLQALVVLNDPQFVEASRVLAQRVRLARPASIEQQVSLACQLATGVNPRPAVLQLLVDSYHDELDAFKQAPEKAEAFLKVGESPRDTAIDASEHAALAVVMSMIFNLDETCTRG